MNSYRCRFRIKGPSGTLIETGTVIEAYSRTEAERILKELFNVDNVISIVSE